MSPVVETVVGSPVVVVVVEPLASGVVFSEVEAVVSAVGAVVSEVELSGVVVVVELDSSLLF
mgnify:FL=1